MNLVEQRVKVTCGVVTIEEAVRDALTLSWILGREVTFDFNCIPVTVDCGRWGCVSLDEPIKGIVEEKAPRYVAAYYEDFEKTYGGNCARKEANDG